MWRSLKDSYRHRSVKAAKSGSSADGAMESWEYSEIMGFYHQYQRQVDGRQTLQGGLAINVNLAADENESDAPSSPAFSSVSEFGFVPSPLAASRPSMSVSSNYANSVVSKRVKRKMKTDDDNENENEQDEASLKEILSVASKLLSGKSTESGPPAPMMKFGSYWQSLDRMWQSLPDDVTTSLFCSFINMTSEAIAKI